MEFKVGDKVVYPNQGVCLIKGLCDREIAGRNEQFYVLEILANSSAVMIPVSNVDNVGLRRLCEESDLENLFEILGREIAETESDWKTRYKENVEKMKSGCIFEVGEVLQDLHFLSHQKPLSFREKKMYDRARQLVVSEVAMVRSEDVEQSALTVQETLHSAYERSADAVQAV